MGKGLGLTSRTPQQPKDYEYKMTENGVIHGRSVLSKIYIEYKCITCESPQVFDKHIYNRDASINHENRCENCKTTVRFFFGGYGR